MDEKKTLEILSTVPLTEAQQNRIKALGKHIHLTVSAGISYADLPKEAWEKAEVFFTDGKQLPAREQVAGQPAFDHGATVHDQQLLHVARDHG